MLQHHPHVKCIRFCDETDAFGNMINKLIIDTDMVLPMKRQKYELLCLRDLAAEIREFQIKYRMILGHFHKVEVTGKSDGFFESAG